MIHIETPLLHSALLSAKSGTNIWLKMDALQPTASFKARGVGFACTKYVADGATLLVSSSGGNAGLAVAYSSRQLGVPATIVVPKVTPKRAIQLMRAEGASVEVAGESWLEAHSKALKLAKEPNSAYIHPFDDPYVWEGHSTLADEFVQSGVPFDGVILSVGGGGMLSGVVMGLKRHGLNVPILAMETIGADSYNTAVTTNEHVTLPEITSLANTLGAKQVAAKAFELYEDHPIVSDVVSDKTAVQACVDFLDDHRVLVEPACGATLSAVYERNAFLNGKKNVIVVVCGGAGITQETLRKFVKMTS